MKISGMVFSPRLGRNCGFTRADLVMAAALACFLGVWAWSFSIGEQGRAVRCAWNMRGLGKAMGQYAGIHGGALPAAGVSLDKVQTTWDLELLPLLQVGSGKTDSSDFARKAQRNFLCPSDGLTHSGAVRSYAMAGHDMTPRNWPPGPDIYTGVGLKWDKAAVQSLLGDEALKSPESLPGFKVSDIALPSATVLVAEYIAAENTLGKFQSATVSGGAQQFQGLPKGGIHGGTFNYLMADGRVERLSPLQTGSMDGKGGIWSIKKDH